MTSTKQSKKILIWYDSNGKRVRVTFDNRKLISGLLNAIDNDNLQREDLAYVIAQILHSLSSSSKKVEFRNEKLEDKKLDNERMPFSQDIVLQTSSLEKGLNNVCNEKSLNYPEALNPFTPALSKIRLNNGENAKLDKFLNAVTHANNANELNEVINTALEKLDRINARNEGDWSFANFVLFKMSLDEFSEDERKNIIRKLMLRGATFDEDLLQLGDSTEKIQNKLEIEPHPRLHNQLTELRKIAENASIAGTVKDVEFDNKTFCMEFSQDSIVDVKKVMEGAKKLGFDKGDVKFGSDIIKIGNNEVELRAEQDGKMNYLDVSDNGSIKITFHTNRGDLNVNLFHNPQNHDKVLVRVNDPKLWEEFKTEAVVKNCLLGGVPIEKAVEKGNFERCGRLGIEKDPINAKDTWVNRVLKDSKTTSLGL